MSNLALLTRYDYNDYLLWDGDWELIEGVPVSISPSPMRIHQQIASELFFALKQALDEECKCELLYETDWKVSNDTVLRPDIALVCDDDNERYISKTPKIIIEILSPSTAGIDERVKYNIYEDEKVDYYILVYPDDLIAKVYKIEMNRYCKVGDYTGEMLVFEDIEYLRDLDFKKVFKKFKK